MVYLGAKRELHTKKGRGAGRRVVENKVVVWSIMLTYHPMLPNRVVIRDPTEGPLS